MVIPKSASAVLADLGGSDKRSKEARNDVPACSPLIPESAMMPVAADNSSSDIPSIFATGAAYLKLYCMSKIPAADWLAD
ncbi:Uncharacterised protein [Streptococcus pneumoniae]|nr:Uncharacterised protein [Streptococcus pneumoniae]COP87824.1 Uncharacterised protein [Streptococcus pneumoniae]COQ76760.1 Uncharacterised protein [Streptococcus pneumoniae]COR40278.1 Uncharacterised protein [Streptococcus pneumoniae]CRG02407.1 Uncharacterised protein [Streptococcus pneumoniae]